MTASVRLSNQTDEWWIINISRAVVLATPPAWCDSILPPASPPQPRVISSSDISLFNVPGTTKNTPGPADVSAADKIIRASCGYITRSHWKLGENSKAKVKPSEKKVSSSFQAAVNLLYAFRCLTRVWCNNFPMFQINTRYTRHWLKNFPFSSVGFLYITHGFN